MYKQLIPAEMITRKHQAKQRLADRAMPFTNRPTETTALQPLGHCRRAGDRVRHSAGKAETWHPNRQAQPLKCL